ncbi:MULTISPECIES: hypothetical protein [unclassified Campylobacter]|uniref:hypothetical protein n=1 Tax=unclassified Campylobacter TaxID=2593542 RepID=UPI003D335BF7
MNNSNTKAKNLNSLLTEVDQSKINSTNSNYNHSKELLFSSFLVEISTRIFKEDEYTMLIDKLEKIYTKNNRHQYSEITAYLMMESRVRRECLDIIAENIRHLYESKELAEYDNPELNLKNKVFKLLDHISLERIRLDDILDFKENFEVAKKDIKNFNKILIDATEETRHTGEELKKSQKNYVSILGIFASIILAFVANITFSSSVLQNIDKPNTFKLVSIICFLGIFVVNILNLLFNFIREIHFGQKTEGGCCSKIWLFNIIIIFIATVCLIKSFNYDENVRKTSENNSTINFNITKYYTSP